MEVEVVARAELARAGERAPMEHQGVLPVEHREALPAEHREALLAEHREALPAEHRGVVLEEHLVARHRSPRHRSRGPVPGLSHHGSLLHRALTTRPCARSCTPALAGLPCVCSCRTFTGARQS
ncbi:hypothetical protein BN2475_710020 [Paraburkholderia ribeironis]|uniref:Uncharacterized protein n=1 Tax=Paraburkholderia ribeironis TaxID=1247936 RepID=A0A1N7SJ78_9BURK|nr:hypothetical protein BN2475_710020 [Paraburkholderia ribeironis]